MEISIASATSTSQQANSVREKVPMYLREGAESFITLLEDYYSYLNSDGLPSQKINNIVVEQDIDRTSAQYIDLIQREIAKNVPKAAAFDKVSLYKKIVNYYLTKGSEDSIINFFKIFYDDAISITYPRERLFKPSAGSWDDENKRYRDVKGFTSDRDVLQDSHFWQDFSYVIETSLQVDQWKNEFLGLVHPAGFKFFGVLCLLITRKSNWIGRFVKYDPATRQYTYDGLPENYVDLYKTKRTYDLDWLKSLTSPNLSTESGYDGQSGDHMPLFQVGLYGNYLRYLVCALANADDASFDRIVTINLSYWSGQYCDRYTRTRTDYLQNLKFLDSDSISEYYNINIENGSIFDCDDEQIYDTLNSKSEITELCLGNEEDLDFVNENGDCINIVQLTESSDEIIEKEDDNPLYVRKPNLLDSRKFSNISAFIDIIDTSTSVNTLIARDVDNASPDYHTDRIIASDGSGIAMRFTVQEFSNYLQPDGTSYYLQSDGSYYKRPYHLDTFLQSDESDYLQPDEVSLYNQP